MSGFASIQRWLLGTQSLPCAFCMLSEWEPQGVAEVVFSGQLFVGIFITLSGVGIMKNITCICLIDIVYCGGPKM